MKVNVKPFDEQALLPVNILADRASDHLLDEKLHGLLARKLRQAAFEFKPDQPNISEPCLDRYCYVHGIVPMKSPERAIRGFNVPEYIQIGDWVFVLDHYTAGKQHFYYKLKNKS